MLSVVPTPIGNLKDITLRALEVLKSVDGILCEDTRQTQKLLRHYEIQKPLFSFHEHSSKSKLDNVLDRLREGEHLALVSDGGTPVVSDPGFEIIHCCLFEEIPVEVLPGPTAVTTALVASGLAVDAFSFFGFLPMKSAARKKVLDSLKEREETLIFYESPYRVGKALQDMVEVFGEREVAIARELTKKFEEVVRGKLEDLAKKYEDKKVLGEVVILVSGKGRKEVFKS